jgi:quinolinate synthase
MSLVEKIQKLKIQKNTLILAHFYQVPEIQEIADFVEDSLGLARRAASTNADSILFAGVHFMAETAKILNPTKKVWLPDLMAGCSLADSCAYEDFKSFKELHPDHVVVSYINCSAAIKTLSDVICTSGNAVEIVNSYPKDQPIIFAPDKNLGAYINQVTGRNMLLWNGSCKVHELLKIEKVIELKGLHPKAKLIAHPECKAIILEMADFIGSTARMLEFIQSDNAQSFIVATETGILHQMKKIAPDKEFIIVPADETCACNDCEYMKMNTLEKVYLCLRDEKPEILLSEDLMTAARKPILKMLEISANIKK